MSDQVRQLLRNASAQHRAGNLTGARARYRAVLQRAPEEPDALHLLGLVEHQEGDSESGRALIQRAIALRPGAALFHANLGRLLRARGEVEAALASWREALRLEPGLSDAALPLARLLRDQGCLDEALQGLATALAARPGQPALTLEAAACEQDLNRQEAAIARYRKLTGDPAVPAAQRAEARVGIATSLFLQDRPAEALAACERVLSETPGQPPALWMRAVLRAALCDWPAPEAPGSPPAPLGPELAGLIESGRLIPQPFALASLTADPALLRRASENWIASHAPAAGAPLSGAADRPVRRARTRLRIGYLSSEMRAHAMGWLMAGLYEAHDRDRFEIAIYSHGQSDGSAIEARIKAAADDWVDIAALPHEAAARRIRDDGVDILVDLKGHTVGARPRILAARPAPLQVAWLGYPGTTGAPYLDYILADRHVIRPGEEHHFSEAVVTLPGCYQVTDPARAIAPLAAERAAERIAAGLPAEAFVFCCFNQLHKIVPAVFARWLALLRAVEGSRLWLLDGPEAARDNLRRQLAEAGLDPGRLVFAPRVEQARHLARHRLADLFLDTLPYGAHTTASDALWAGLPLVTCSGESFAGRVAGSLLHALGLPELIAETLDDYQALALALARDPGRLAVLRRRIEVCRSSGTLFDCAGFTRGYEHALLALWRRWLDGETPSALAIEPEAASVEPPEAACPARAEAPIVAA